MLISYPSHFLFDYATTSLLEMQIYYFIVAQIKYFLKKTGKSYKIFNNF